MNIFDWMDNHPIDTIIILVAICMVLITCGSIYHYFKGDSKGE